MGQIQKKEKNETPSEKLEGAMEQVKDKIEAMNGLIDDLAANLDPASNKKEVSNTQNGTRNKILLKYYKYVTYLRNILVAKQTKDKKIMSLTGNAFDNYDEVLKKFGLIQEVIKKKMEENKEKSIQERRAQQASKAKNKQEIQRLKGERDNAKEELKKKRDKAETSYALININNAELTKYKHEFNVNGELINLNTKLGKCTNNIGNAINKFSENLNAARKQLGGNMTIASKSNVNVDILQEIILVNDLTPTTLGNEKIKKHITNLKELKRKYEEGLDKNIIDYKKICVSLQQLNSEVIKQFEITCLWCGETSSNSSPQTIEDLEREIEDINKNLTDIKTGNIVIKGLPLGTLNIEGIFESNKAAINVLDGEITKFYEGILKGKNTIRQMADVTVTERDQSSELVSTKISSRGPATSPTTGQQKQQDNPGQKQTAQSGKNVQPTGQNADKQAALENIQEAIDELKEMENKNANNTNVIEKKQKIINLMDKYENKEKDDDFSEIMDDYDYLDACGGNKELCDEIKQQQNKDKVEEIDVDNYNQLIQELNTISGEIENASTIQFIDMLFNDPELQPPAIPESGLPNDLEDYIKNIVRDVNNKHLLSKQKMVIMKEMKEMRKLRDSQNYKDIGKILFLKKIFLALSGKGEKRSLSVEDYIKSQSQGGKSKKTKSKSKKGGKATKSKKGGKSKTKSYNNPKYKKQSGGFVRGGVLFPESFYRTDVVM